MRNTKRQWLLLLSLITGVCLQSAAQVEQLGNVKQVRKDGQTVYFKLDKGIAQLTAYSPAVIRVRIDKQVLEPDFSYAVTAKPVAATLRIEQQQDKVLLTTDSLRIVVHRSPFAIAFYTPDGKVINEDEQGLTTSWVGTAVTAYKKMQDNEHFVGLGEKTGNIDRKGNGYTNWNSDVYGYAVNADPLYATIPFYIGIHSGLNYGIFLDNTYQTDFNFGASNDRFSSFGARGGELNYYFIYHKRVADIIRSYSELTGKMPLPPKWALGYQQNRYSYYPETEVMRIAGSLREKRIPADGITLDIHYMDAYKLFTWNKDRFPDPLKMNRDLEKMGFRTTVIVDPGIKVEKGGAYERGLNDDIYIKYPDGKPYTGQVWPGWCNFPDFTSEKGRDWWHNEVKFFAESGVSGIWNDMNEIATWGQKMPDNVLFNYDGKPANHLKAHNIYGLQMARSSYEGARKQFPERPFILTRSGYAGLQRYSALWTGDNRAEEDHMLTGVRLLSSLGLSGVPFAGMDIGGFTGNPTPSLYSRWISLGAFTPYFRNHTANNTKAAEPWSFGEEILDVARNYISLRYQLMPYLYSSFYEASQTGMPVVRSLAIDHTHDPRVLDAQFQNEYLFGPAFLVTPFESTRDYGKIYFPAGKWYNMYTDETIPGQTELVIGMNAKELPVFVKGGSIITTQSLVQSTSIAPSDTLTVHIYNGDRNSFVYYEDDGKSFEYQSGNYYKRTISFDPATRSISFSRPEGTFNTHFKHIQLALHGFKDMKVTADGVPVALITEAFAWLGAGNNPDKQANPYPPKSSKILTFTVANKAGINIKY